MKVKGSVLHFYLFFIIKSRFQSIFSETELKSKIPYLTAKKKTLLLLFWERIVIIVGLIIYGYIKEKKPME